MIQRGVAALLALFHICNGIFMLTAPRVWFAAATGHEAPPFLMAHFVYDIGLSFIASGAGFAVFCLQPGLWAAALIGALFPLLHSLMHVWSTVLHPHFDMRDALLWIAPGLIGLGVVWPAGRQRSMETKSPPLA